MRRNRQLISASLAVAAICIGLTFWYAHSTGTESGYRAGYGAGYTEAKDEKPPPHGQIRPRVKAPTGWPR